LPDLETSRRLATLEANNQTLTSLVDSLRAQLNAISTRQIQEQIIKGTGSVASSGSSGAIGNIVNQLKIILRNGFAWVTDKVDIKLQSTPGLSLNAAGLGVLRKTNMGIACDTTGIYVLIAANSGLSVGASGLAAVIKAGGGLGVGSGGLFLAELLGLQKSADPPAPADGSYIIWMSDGTGKGDSGDVLIASTSGAVTTWATLFDYSAGAAW